jgi:hypothetical protein
VDNPILGIDIVARLDAFREELKAIPDIGAKEARALTTQLSREIKKSEKAAGKAAAASRKAGKDAEAQGAKTTAAWEDTKDALKGAGVAVGIFGVAAAGAFALAAKGAVGLIRHTLALSEEWNALGKEARSVGTSVEEFQRVGGALRLLTKDGVNVTQAIQDFQKRTGEALPDLVALADEISALESPAERTTRAMELFGEEAGRKMAGALTVGGAAVAEAIEQVERHGLVSAEAVAQSELLQDSVALATQEFETLVRTGLAPVVPAITTILSVWADLMAAFRIGAEDDIAGAGEALGEGLVQAAINASVQFASFAKDAELAFGPIRASIEGLILGFQAVQAAISGDMDVAGNFYRLAKDKGAEAIDATLGMAEGWRQNREEVALLRYELTVAAKAQLSLIHI